MFILLQKSSLTLEFDINNKNMSQYLSDKLCKDAQKDVLL